MKRQPTIIFNRVSKSFNLNRRGSLKRRISHFGQSDPDIIPVIKDVSFSLHQKEVVGLFGPNGSGKSTILRLAANIIKPDTGTVSTIGKIAPVIELGSGLHPELTGKQNILLYASILGMSRQQVHSQLDKIIAFSDLGPFINYPIKKYSSGMKARLAFSVAIFSNADIFLFDEVFAVGDTFFVDKSIRLLNRLRRSKSILLTSHNLGLMQQLCDNILILDQGVLLNQQNQTLITFIKQMPPNYEFVVKALSNSMYPLIKPGDLITAKKIGYNTIKTGDVILFHLPNFPQIITHRVADIMHEKTGKICITRGDNSFGFDVWKIRSTDYLGKVVKIGQIPSDKPNN